MHTVLNISSPIEAVIKSHERSLVSRGFTLDGKPFDSTLFTEWVKHNANTQRLQFYDANQSPYEIDVFKLAYLARLMPVTTASMVKLVDNWPINNFIDWVNSVESIGICSLGSGPGSDIFGTIHAILNKTNHKKKVRYVVRNESLSTWEHFYQCLKKEIITGNSVENKSYIYSADFSDIVENENETLTDVLKNCYDEWVSQSSEDWASAVSYAKCNVLTMQCVINDAQTKDDEQQSFNRFEAIKNQISMIVKYSGKPLFVLISDIKTDKAK